MIKAFDDLLKQYECGAMTRRQLLAAMTLVVAPVPAPAQTSLFRARSLNHVNFRVTDVARSEAFYRKVLGVPSARPAAGAAFSLDLPAGGFISLCPLSVPTCGIKKDGRPGDIDHVGIGIDKFDADRVEAELMKAGFKPYNKTGPSVFVEDPDGTPIQLSAVSEKFPVRP